MPTLDEMKELLNNCTWEWTTQNGVNGRKVTGPNGNCIFLPAAGYRYGEDVNYRGSDGDYWFAALDKYDSFYAYYLNFNDGDYGWYFDGGRYYGLSVRPVTE